MRHTHDEALKYLVNLELPYHPFISDLKIKDLNSSLTKLTDKFRTNPGIYLFYGLQSFKNLIKTIYYLARVTNTSIVSIDCMSSLDVAEIQLAGFLCLYNFDPSQVSDKELIPILSSSLNSKQRILISTPFNEKELSANSSKLFNSYLDQFLILGVS